MKLLMVSTCFPLPLTHGTYLRIFALGKALAVVHEPAQLLNDAKGF